MHADCAEPVGQSAPSNLCDDLAACIAELDLARADISVRRRAESYDAPTARDDGSIQQTVMLAVSRQNGSAAALQSLEDLGLRLRNALLAIGKIPDVHGQHVRDDGDVWARHARERTDLARMIHADLDHGEIDVGRHPRECQRHTPVIVERLLGRMHLARCCETRAQHFLGAGLAGAACHGDDACIRSETCARCHGNTTERRQRIVDADKRPCICRRVEVAPHERCDCPPFESSTDKIVPITRIGERDEDLARCERARIDRKAGYGAGWRAFRCSPGCCDERIPGPERRAVSHGGVS